MLLKRDFFDRSPLYAYYCAPMADTPIPDYVDSKKIFNQQALIEGSVAISHFGRFVDLLSSAEGRVDVSFRFHVDDEYRRVISGTVKTQVWVICQRCLEPTKISIDDTFSLAVVESESQVARLPSHLDPWLCEEDNRLFLLDIIEEQLMLCMPIVSVHPENCLDISQLHDQVDAQQTTGNKGKQGKPNPFDILKTLKETH